MIISLLFFKKFIFNIYYNYYKFNKFWIKAKRQNNKKLKIYQTNNGTEFNYITKICQNNGIIHKKTAPYIHKQAKAIERIN